VLVWGGAAVDMPGPGGTKVPVDSGGRYDPARDRWGATDADGAPSARVGHVTVWTGSELLVWGGEGALQRLQTGAAFTP
jgi:hypothetical protein